MIDFSKKVTTTSESIIEDPIKLYEKLDRTSEAGPLRESQKTVLSCWYKSHLNKKDVVIKLHTGVGKSLIGLLVLYSRLKTEDGPCMYICPNKYLASQLTLEASKFGIPVCTICENNELPEEFLNSKRILITHVQKVFNGMTKFRTGGAYLHVGNIVLDDAHACLDSIRDAFVMKIKRNDGKELYNELRSFRHDYINILRSLKLGIDTHDLPAIEQIYNQVLKDSGQALNQSKYDLGRLSNIHNDALKSVCQQNF